jgi:AraC-like DNA-binding protein
MEATMPSLSTRFFEDSDKYREVLHPQNVELLLMKRGSFSAKILRMDLGRVQVEQTEANLPRVVRRVLEPHQDSFLFRTDTGPPALWNSLNATGKVMAHSGSTDYYLRSSGHSRWLRVSIASELLSEACQSLIGIEHTKLGAIRIFQPPPAIFARLRHLHDVVNRFAAKQPNLIITPEQAQALEQLAVTAITACMVEERDRNDYSALRKRGQVMARFERLLDDNPDRPLHMFEICASIGIASRTLRTCCREFLGMGPNRYLLQRRMLLARRALAAADPCTSNVTEIAVSFGFWELGRFAGVYKSLFGESPSATLRRAPDEINGAGQPQFLQSQVIPGKRITKVSGLSGTRSRTLPRGVPQPVRHIQPISTSGGGGLSPIPPSTCLPREDG